MDKEIDESRSFKVDPDHARSSAGQKNRLKKFVRSAQDRATAKRKVAEEVVLEADLKNYEQKFPAGVNAFHHYQHKNNGSWIQVHVNGNGPWIHRDKNGNRHTFDDKEDFKKHMSYVHEEAINEAKDRPLHFSSSEDPGDDHSIHTGADLVKQSKGTHKFHRGFFYTSGTTSSQFADSVSDHLKKNGVMHTVLAHGTKDFVPFKGGAPVDKQNHHWVQVKIHGKSDAIKEDEQIDELSAAKLWKYAVKASDQADRIKAVDDKSYHTKMKRDRGADLASRKVYTPKGTKLYANVSANPGMAEEVEQIDEIGNTLAGQNALRRYRHKAGKDMHIQREVGKDFTRHAEKLDSNNPAKRILKKLSKTKISNAEKRAVGIGRASWRIKEEAEQLDEIGNTDKGQTALRSYMHKSAKSYAKLDNAGDDHHEIAGKFSAGHPARTKAIDKAGKLWDKAHSRMIGLQRAGKRIKEEAEQLDEVGDTKKGREVLQKVIDRAKPKAIGYGYHPKDDADGHKAFRNMKTVGRAENRIKDNTPIKSPKVHDLRHMKDDGEVYDHTQTSDHIKNGDVMHLHGNRSAVMFHAWPTMVHGKSNALHTFNHQGAPRSHTRSVNIAKSIVKDHSIKKEEFEGLEEGLRLIGTHTSASGKKAAKVYRDAEWEEYRVQHHVDGKHQKNADYHTSDKDDAHGTAKHFVKESVEQIDEIGDTPRGQAFLSRYVDKASDSAVSHDLLWRKALNRKDHKNAEKHDRLADKRMVGSFRAAGRLKEESDMDNEDKIEEGKTFRANDDRRKASARKLRGWSANWSKNRDAKRKSIGDERKEA